MGGVAKIFQGESSSEKRKRRQAEAVQAEQARLAREKKIREKRELAARRSVIAGRSNGSGSLFPSAFGQTNKSSNFGVG